MKSIEQMESLGLDGLCPLFAVHRLRSPEAGEERAGQERAGTGLEDWKLEAEESTAANRIVILFSTS
jgi:hypothetical protein